MWNDLDLGISYAALWTKSAVPIPDTLSEEYDNTEAIQTVLDNPDLFEIVTPINVPCFCELLVKHPNQPLVESVCNGLTNGFWPFANTHYSSYPLTLDDSGPPPKIDEYAAFLQKQTRIEVEAGHYS